METLAYQNQRKRYLKISIFILALFAFNLQVLKSYAQRVPWITPQVAKGIQNPVPSNSAVLTEGKTLYVANCAPCHGEKGRGDGPAAQALNPKPADHSSALVQSETDGSLFWKLSEGRNPMPSYKKILTDKQRWELVSYIRTLAKSGKK